MEFNHVPGTSDNEQNSSVEAKCVNNTTHKKAPLDFHLYVRGSPTIVYSRDRIVRIWEQMMQLKGNGKCPLLAAAGL